MSKQINGSMSKEPAIQQWNEQMIQEMSKQTNECPMSPQSEIMTIKDEENIRAIMDEVEEGRLVELDGELQELLNRQQKRIKHKYEEKQMYRMGYNFDQEWNDSSFQSQEHENQQSPSEFRNAWNEQKDEQDFFDLKHIQFEEQTIYANIELQPPSILKLNALPHFQEHVLDIFEREQLCKEAKTEEYLQFLTSSTPKYNILPYVHHHYPIFNIKPSHVQKYFAFHRINLSSLIGSTMLEVDGAHWQIWISGRQMYGFESEYWKQPIIVKVDGEITKIEGKEKYIAIAFANISNKKNYNINIYHIKSNNVVLLKSLNSLNLPNIDAMKFTSMSPLTLFFSSSSQLASVTIEYALIFTKIKLQEIQHNLKNIYAWDVLTINECITEDSAKNGANSQISTILNNGPLIAIAALGVIELWRAGGDGEKLWEQKLAEDSQNQHLNHLGQSKSQECLRWRKPIGTGHPQLIFSSGCFITIYKLLPHPQDPSIPCLVPHLRYRNHFPVIALNLLSSLHLLIISNENVAVAALPLMHSGGDIQINQGCIVGVGQKWQVLGTEGRNIVVITEEGAYHQSSNFQSADRSGEWQILSVQLKDLRVELDELMLQKGNFREAFILLTLIFKGMNYSFFFQYTQSALDTLLHSSLTLCLSSLLPNSSNELLVFRISWAAQLCIETEHQTWIWTSIYPKAKQKSNQSILFSVVESYGIRGLLKSIPEDIFYQMIEYYASGSKDAVIEHLILSNKENFDGLKLISLLNSKEMFYMQFYLFSQSLLSVDPDFFTPYLKAFSSFANYVDLGNHQKSRKIGLICLWYLRKCFSFQQIPHGMMGRDKKVEVVTSFFLQSISRTFLKRLGQFDMKLLLQSYLTAWSNAQFKQIIEQEEEMIIQKYMDRFIERKDTSVETKSFVELFLFHFQTNLNIKKHLFVFSQFYALILYFTSHKCSFDKITDLLIVLFQNKFTSFALSIKTKTKMPTTQQLKKYLILLIEKELKEKRDRLWIKKLLSFEDRQICYLLHKIDKSYNISLQYYLSQKKTEGLIAFIYQIWQQIEQMEEESQNFIKKRKILQVKNFLSKNVTLLFRINKQEALELFYHMKQTTASIHAMIENNMGEKIHFLTAVLLKFKDQEFESKETYLSEHLQEVCCLPQEEMIRYLDTFYYPLDMAINICEQKGKYLAKAIFEERSGMIEESFKSYEKLIKAIIYNGHDSEMQTRKKVNQYIQQCIRICKKYSGQTNQENSWIKIIKFINSFILSNHQTKIYLKVQFQRMMQIIIKEMFQFLPTSLLISFFTSKIKLELGSSKEISIFNKLFQMAKFDTHTVLRAMTVTKIDMRHNRKEINTEIKKGIPLIKFCDFCKSKLSEQDKILVYYCGHSFHKICHDDEYRCLSCFYESDCATFASHIFKLNQNRRIQHHARSNVEHRSKNNQIFIESFAKAQYEQRKKNLKLHGYELELQQRKFYEGLIDV